MASLGDVLANRVKARWKVLLADACHSGKINPETTNETVDAELKSLPGNFLTLTATTERESSYEDPALSTGFGLFSYFLVQAFKGEADNDPCDGKITADELVEYVRANVKRQARSREVFQTPSARGDYEPSMILGVSVTCLKTTTPATSLEGTAVVESTMDDVDVYLDGNLIGRVSQKKPLALPGLSSGLHKFEGTKQGYEPDRKEIMIVPGQEITVTLRIRYTRTIKKSSLDLVSDGEKLLLTQRSTVNPLNVLPTSRTQNTGDLRKARDLFTRAFAEDSNNSKAAFDLGQVNQLLSEPDASLKAYKTAVELDPSYTDARRQYAAVLIESGDVDEAIRQLVEGSRLDPRNDESFALMSRAYWDKAAWDRAIDMANEALELNPSNEQAYLWKGDAFRQLAAIEKVAEKRKGLYENAREGYQRFVSLTNYSTPATDWIAFHFIGMGLGSRRHADRQASYSALRNAGFLGMCLCEQNLGNPLKAKEYCQQAIKYDSDDPMAHFILGNVYRDLFNNTERCDYIQAARDSYSKMLKLNGDIAEAKNAREYLLRIEKLSPLLRTKGCRL
jgi:tetratricopeptide (TPR) repeat protein